MRRSMVARIATLSRNGRPSINPLYFVYLNGHIWLGTVDWTLAARNVNADPVSSRSLLRKPSSSTTRSEAESYAASLQRGPPSCWRAANSRSDLTAGMLHKMLVVARCVQRPACGGA
jgi:Pyridoxamine 5'-phosphate oxidase